MKPTTRRGTATLTVLLLMAGCAGRGDRDKAGGEVEPLVLEAWSSEAADRPSGTQLTEFAQRVAKVSGGRLVIKATYGSPSANADPDQAVIRSVKGDAVSIGLVAARAFSTEGVDSFTALTAPFVIETTAGAAAVARDRAVTVPMLSGLATVGLTGLGLIPETVRRPFGVRDPVLGPEDYAGKGLRSLRSTETYEIFSALGAKPGFWEGDELAARTKDGMVSVIESSFALASGVMEQPGIATGNVAFFPRMNVVFANAKAIERLSPEQRTFLTTASVQARDAWIARQPSEADAAASYCASGGQVVLATDGQRAALRAKVAAYVAHLEGDPVVHAELAAIRSAVAAVPEPQQVQACGPNGGSNTDALAPWPVRTTPSQLDGRYRVEVTDEALSAVGVPDDAIAELHGTFTWTISKGTMSFDRVAPNPLKQTHEVWYLAIRDHQAMLIDSTPEPQRTAANILWAGSWSLDDNGDLRFTDYKAGEAAAPFDRVWWFGTKFTRLR